MSNLHRIQWIDAQIRAKKFPNSRSIAEHFEISIRQASRDIEYLRYSMGAPLEYSAKENGYFYSGSTFALPSLFIGEEEKKALSYLADQYQALKSTQAAQLAELFGKLTDMPSGKVRQYGGLPVYDVNPSLIQTYHVLKTAIDDHTVVEITYTSSTDDATSRIVSPYKLFSRNGRSYLVGYCDLRKDVRVFRLDRILQLAYTKKPYIMAANYREEDYSEDISFRFNKPYVCTILSDSPIHFGTLKAATEHQDKCLHRVEFYDSGQLLQLLLVQPSPFVITHPKWLREKLKSRLSQLLDLND